MGFSLSASFAVIGVSILISVEILTGGIIPTITEIDNSYNEMINRGVNKIQTDINITNVNVSTNSSNYDYNITLKNTGSISLETSEFIILINGLLQEFSSSDLYFYAERETNILIKNVTGNGLKRLKIITDNGISDYYEIII
jgi:archaellum component FlaF (FlaF/FlaG flagellin family)